MSERECPLIPMGAITGKPSKKFITETLEAYRRAGITQYLIYPRSGCELEYLSEEWFETCGHIVSEAERLGFTSIWLYDEFNWPSGTCNKQLMKEHPEFALDQLCVDEKGGVVLRKNPNMSALMNPEAVRLFIRMTHERYAERFGRYFGALVKGIFTDEPDIAYFSYEEKGDRLRLPWYSGLEEDYRAQTNRDLHADLTGGTSCYQETCNRLFAARFRKSFAEALSRWCEEHGLLLTGHLMNEHASGPALSCSGHPLRVLDAFSFPGMDEIFTRNRIGTIEWPTFGTLMHAAEAQGNRGALAELFALGPSDLTPAQVRRQLWLAASFGVSHYVMAVAQLDHRGNSMKTGWFNPFSRTQPWFEAYPELGEEAKRAAAVATRERECRVAVRYPYQPVPLGDLLRRLTEGQYSWKLALPEEETGADVVLDFMNGGLREERSGAWFGDFGRLENELLSKRELRSVTVETLEGGLAPDLFLRIFADGSLTILDFSGRDRELVLKRRGVEARFRLSAEGVLTFPGWQIELDRPSVLRSDFKGGEVFEFTLQEAVPGLRLAVRNCAGVPEIRLDGQPVALTGEAESLPQGFREIYRETAVLDLAPGSHRLEWTTPVEEYPYLPAAFLTGPFAADREGVLTRRRGDGRGLYGYAGRISQTGVVSVPPDATKLSVDTAGLATELLLNGHSLGKRLWAPFTWILPEELRGCEVELRLIRFTSCGPLFGEAVFARYPHHWANEFRPDNSKTPAPHCELRWE